MKEQIYCLVQNEDASQTLIAQKRELNYWWKGREKSIDNTIDAVINQAGQYAPLAGGGMEGKDNNDPQQTAARELKEECGVNIAEYTPTKPRILNFTDKDSQYSLVIYTISDDKFSLLQTDIIKNISPEAQNPSKPAGEIRDWESGKVEVVPAHLLPSKLGFPQLVTLDNEDAVEEKKKNNPDSQSITWYKNIAETVQQAYISTKLGSEKSNLEQEATNALTAANKKLDTEKAQRKAVEEQKLASITPQTNQDFSNYVNKNKSTSQTSTLPTTSTTSHSSVSQTISRDALKLRPRVLQSQSKPLKQPSTLRVNNPTPIQTPTKPSSTNSLLSKSTSSSSNSVDNNNNNTVTAQPEVQQISSTISSSPQIQPLQSEQNNNTVTTVAPHQPTPLHASTTEAARIKLVNEITDLRNSEGYDPTLGAYSPEVRQAVQEYAAAIIGAHPLTSTQSQTQQQQETGNTGGQSVSSNQRTSTGINTGATPTPIAAIPIPLSVTQSLQQDVVPFGQGSSNTTLPNNNVNQSQSK